jgi:mevalonate kinase
VRALYAALGCSLEQDVLNELVYEAETFHHGTPSGIDNTVIVYERPVYFVRGKPIERLVVSKPLFLLIADTGISASTRLSVADVRCLYDSDPLGTRSITSAIGDLVIQARGAIQCGDEGLLGELMVRNQELLRRLDVSSPGIDRLVKAASDAGGLGAKLSGGGRGGNVIVLVASDAAVRSHVCAALLSAGAVRVFETVVS